MKTAYAKKKAIRTFEISLPPGLGTDYDDITFFEPIRFKSTGEGPYGDFHMHADAWKNLGYPHNIQVTVEVLP